MGWGMLPSCSCYVDATLMGGVGWGGACYRHVHVTLMLRMRPPVGKVKKRFTVVACVLLTKNSVFTVYYIE